MRILYVSPEVVPFSKTGGLADVAGALPSALAAAGCEVRVATLFAGSPVNGDPPTVAVPLPPIRVPVAGRSEPLSVRTLEDHVGPVTHFFFAHDEFFRRADLYVDPKTGRDYPDNDARFTFFARAILEWLRHDGWCPDIIHLNDWQTALIAPYLALEYREAPALSQTRTVLTVHNLAYQGVFPPERYPLLGFPEELFRPTAPFEFWGKVNFLKAGLVYADKLGTVSPTYAQEIQGTPEFGCGLEDVLRSRRADLTGILNGIDEARWNPAADPLIVRPYTADALDAKTENKYHLCERCGFPKTRRDRPLIGMISRLAEQKGFDLLAAAAERLFALDVNLVLLGTGDPKFHTTFEKWQKRIARQFRVYLTFDNQLAHQIEAGADIFLMPSRYEPCGLNQMYSLRYGTVPVVRATGGLRDTVIDADADPKSGNGFVFSEYTAEAMLTAVRRAITWYGRRADWARLQRKGMVSDFSWRASAEKYVALYRAALASRPAGVRRAAATSAG